MILYVAGPMSGLPEFNYPAFNDAADLLRDAGYSVLNPVDSEQHNHTGQPQQWQWYMRHALRMVTEADGVALLADWDKSRGAQLEFHVAGALALPCYPLIEWLRDAGSRLTATPTNSARALDTGERAAALLRPAIPE